jgi:hypothetical protein
VNPSFGSASRHPDSIQLSQPAALVLFLYFLSLTRPCHSRPTHSHIKRGAPYSQSHQAGCTLLTPTSSVGHPIHAHSKRGAPYPHPPQVWRTLLMLTSSGVHPTQHLPLPACTFLDPGCRLLQEHGRSGRQLLLDVTPFQGICNWPVTGISLAAASRIRAPSTPVGGSTQALSHPSAVQLPPSNQLAGCLRVCL